MADPDEGYDPNEPDGAATEPSVETQAESAPEPDTNVTTDDELATLRAQLAEASAKGEREAQRAEAEAKRAEEAARRAAEGETKLTQTVADRFYAQEIAAQNAISAAQQEAAMAKEAIDRLGLEGKFREMSEAVQKLSRAEYQIADAERFRASLAGQKQQWEQEQRVAQERPVQQPQRQAPQQPQISDKSRAWIESHPKMLTDQAYQSKAIAAHQATQLLGIPVDSDEYFSFIENQLGERRQMADQDQPPVRRAASAAAPPSRSIAPQAGRSPSTTRLPSLTAEEVAFADQSMGYIKDRGQRLKRYAEGKARMLAGEKPLGNAN